MMEDGGAAGLAKTCVLYSALYVACPSVSYMLV